VRTTQHLLNDLQTLEALGVSVTLMDVGADTSTDTGNIAAAEAGRILPGRLPYGITSDDEGQLLIDEEEAPAVRLMFQMRAQGHSLTDIVRHLNEQAEYRQRPTYDKKATELLRKADRDAEEVYTDGTWRKKTVALMLANPVYAGTYSRTFDGRLFTFDVEPVIDEETFKAVQALQPDVAKVRSSGAKKRHYGLSSRIFHEHAEADLVRMFGRTLKGSRIYRCYAAQSADGSTSDCPGLGQTTTKVGADAIEALALLWMLNSLRGPDRWAEYMAAADETLIKQGAAPDDLEAYEEAVAELEAQLAYIDTRAITLAGQLGPEKAAEWAEEHSAPIRANLEQAQSALERIQGAQTWRKGLEGGLQALMAMDVAQTGDASAGEDHPSSERGSEAWWRYLHEQAQAVLQPSSDAVLSVWTVEETKRLAHLLNLTVVVAERHDWDGMPEEWHSQPLGTLPQVRVTFSPQVGVQKGEASWARGDLNPHDLAITGT
jgi:hypothetical protein